MGGKGRRRREARRRAKQRREERREGLPEEGVAAEAAAAPEPVRAAAGRAARRQAKRRVGLWKSGRRVGVSLGVLGLFAGGVAFLVVGVVSGGSSGTTGGTAPTPTPDPRVAGQTPTASFSLAAGDDMAGLGNSSFFQPNTITASAGEVIEIEVTNVGAVSHNLRLAGLDNVYETGDDFEPQPFAVKPGETGRMLVKIDPPGTYRFRCDFHASVQTGTLILR